MTKTEEVETLHPLRFAFFLGLPTFAQLPGLERHLTRPRLVQLIEACRRKQMPEDEFCVGSETFKLDRKRFCFSVKMETTFFLILILEFLKVLMMIFSDALDVSSCGVTFLIETSSFEFTIFF